MFCQTVMTILQSMLWSTNKIETEKKRDQERDTTEETCIKDYVHHMEMDLPCHPSYFNIEEETYDLMGDLCFPLASNDLRRLGYY
jgi:hypothetical protein